MSISVNIKAVSTGLALVCLWSCTSVRVERHGAPQQTVVGRKYSVDLPTMRAAILRRFARRGAEEPPTIPSPFSKMRAIVLEPPSYPADWLVTWVDPGGFLESYKRIPADMRASDLLIEEPTFDYYWTSEYATAAGPVRFRCGFILHFVQPDPLTTEVQAFEKVPEVWAGEHWAVAHHSIGFAKVHDIRAVEPTVKDRVDLLDTLNEIASTAVAF